jgi:predicted metal-dependent hydrolase
MFSYQLQRNRRSHSIKIKIDPSAQVIVVAPPDCPTPFIDKFVAKHQDWIARNLAKVKEHVEKKQLKDSSVDIFGKHYDKEIIFSAREKLGVHISGGKVVINPVSDTKESVEKALTQFFKSTAEKYIVPRTHQLGKIMGISFRDITLRAQKTRWGSCSSQGNLNFNWRLVHCPPHVIDYVIIHELAHRKQMNHSSKFWDIVAKFDPEYLKHRGWLKRNGMDLG